MAFLHVVEVKHLDVVAVCFKQSPGVAQDLTFAVQYDQAGVGVHNVGFGVEPGLARAAASHHQDIQIAPVSAAIQPNGDILCENFVRGQLLIRIFPVDSFWIAPSGGAVFLPPAVVAVGGEVDANPQPIAQQKNEDSFQAVLTPYNVKRMVQRGPAVPHQPHQSAAHIGGQQQGQPDHRNDAAGVEGQVGFGELILPHGQPSVSPVSWARL